MTTTVTAMPDEAIDAPNGRRPIAVQPLQSQAWPQP
ncbi:MAG: hypothetical protein QOG56_1499 [Solirubrobacteraceae bacterium]|nr:hypothetical protein [Solirubrobacteraceae bacterium]